MAAANSGSVGRGKPFSGGFPWSTASNGSAIIEDRMPMRLLGVSTTHERPQTSAPRSECTDFAVQCVRSC